MWGIGKRTPDFTVSRDGDTYLRRWHLLPRNNWFNIYLHHTVNDDDPTALHDHPYWNMSIVLSGGYYEYVPMDPMGGYDAEYWASEASRHNNGWLCEAKAGRYQADKCMRLWRRAGSILFRRATDAHRLALQTVAVLWTDQSGTRVKSFVTTPSWSLFVTGPRRRKWGFWCPKGWTPFDQYVKRTADGNDKGVGCG